MAGTTPLISQVPAKEPIKRRMITAPIALCIPSIMPV